MKIYRAKQEEADNLLYQCQDENCKAITRYGDLLMIQASSVDKNGRFRILRKCPKCRGKVVLIGKNIK